MLVGSKDSEEGTMHTEPKVSRAVPAEEGEALYIRLCHHCGHVNERAEPVGQCDRCGKHLSFYSLLEDLSDDPAEESWLAEDWEGEDGSDSNEMMTSLAEMEDEPILQGLTVLW